MSILTDFVPDVDRQRRLGFPELVYGEHKSPEQLRRIIEDHQSRQQNLLITRMSVDKIPDFADLSAFDPLSRTYLWTPQSVAIANGTVALISAGTSDASVVAEAGRTLEFIGIRCQVHQDIGVAGIQRLLERQSEIANADVLIVVAGFEGALASVVGGLLPHPVIAVPTSVGYGVAAGGHTALHAMLASCANGILVTNIDNGCGAALAAARLLRLIRK